MSSNSSSLIVVFLLSAFSCSIGDERIDLYVASKFDDTNLDSAYLDFRSVFDTNYDTMYVFPEYSQVEGIRLITGATDYTSKNLLMPQGFLVEDSHVKVILMKNGMIVYDEDMRAFTVSGGLDIEKEGTFDGEPFIHKAKLYASRCFIAVRSRSSDRYELRSVSDDHCND